MADTNTLPSVTLRTAADNIRQLANQATPSGEQPHGWNAAMGVNNSPMMFGGPTEDGYRTGTIFKFEEEPFCEGCVRPSLADLDHMAAWHPDVAYAVADLLDVAAKSADFVQSPDGGFPPFTRAAMRIALMFVGADTPSGVAVPA